MINSYTGALITGGLTNIGLATSKKFLNLGISVVAGSSNAGKPIRKRIEKDLHHLAQINNVSFLSINMDVSDEKSVRSAVRKIETQFGLISILVNSAGLGSSNKEICRFGLPIVEFPPMQIKQALTGHGHADKDEVLEAVMRELSLESPPRPDDSADALAVALTGWFQR